MTRNGQLIAFVCPKCGRQVWVSTDAKAARCQGCGQVTKLDGKEKVGVK